jgi:hypothetical protein
MQAVGRSSPIPILRAAAPPPCAYAAVKYPKYIRSDKPLLIKVTIGLTITKSATELRGGVFISRKSLSKLRETLLGEVYLGLIRLERSERTAMRFNVILGVFGTCDEPLFLLVPQLFAICGAQILRKSNVHASHSIAAETSGRHCLGVIGKRRSSARPKGTR